MEDLRVLLKLARMSILEKFENKKVIVAYSGGIDSLLLSILLSEVTETLCIFIKSTFSIEQRVQTF